MSGLHRDELIAQARELEPDLEGLLKHGETDLVLAACEAFWMEDSHDELACGDDQPYTVYRVNRWLVFTDSDGFRACEEEGSVEEAHARFKTCERELGPIRLRPMAERNDAMRRLYGNAD